MIPETNQHRSFLARFLPILVGCLAYAQLMLGIDSVGNSTARWDRIIVLEQLIWLTPLGALLFFWTLAEFRQNTVHAHRMLLAVVLALSLALIAWPLRHFGP